MRSVLRPALLTMVIVVASLSSGRHPWLPGAEGAAPAAASTTAGHPWAWGWNAYGQLGDGYTSTYLQPWQVGSLSGASAARGGVWHTLALKSDGTVWAVGSNDFGQLGDGTTTERISPVQVSGLSGVIAIAAGREHSLALKNDGSVWAWGRNAAGQLGDGTTTDRTTPVQVSGLASVAAVATTGTHSLALKSDGTLWAWGSNTYGQVGDGTTTNRTTPTQVTGLSGVAGIAAGGNHSLAVKSDGTAWAWGANAAGQLGDGTTTNRSAPVQVSGLSGATAVAAGGNHSLALQSDATVWAWGRNDGGQLGDGTTSNRSAPVQASGLSGATAIAAGDAHSLALKSDGTVWAWGANAAGQLGDGTTTNRYAPVQVSGLTNVTAIAAGWLHSLAVKADGTVWAWGNNGWGELGDGTMTNRTTPVQVVGPGGSGFLTGVRVVKGDAAFSLALKDDGTVWAWGNNGEGELGDGTYTLRTAPVQVVGPGGSGVLTDVVDIAVGEWHSLAIKSDGTAWAWGDGSYGQFCDGTTAVRNTPARLGGLRGIVGVGGGSAHTVVLKDDGTVWACGDNYYGQLGDGTTIDRHTPVQVTSLSGIVTLAGGYWHNAAVRYDGTVWSWGENGLGQLGDGTYLSRTSPVQVHHLTGVTVLAAGDDHLLAVLPAWGISVQPAAPGSGQTGPVGAGTGSDPVYTYTGSYTYTRADLAIPGRGPSPVFARTYNSHDTRVGPLGPGWTHSYAVRLRSPGDGTRDLLLTGPQGRADRYTRKLDGSYAPRLGSAAHLVEHQNGTYTVTHRDQTTWTFDTSGDLTGIADRFGNQSALAYNAGRQLITIGDPAGRGALSLVYGPLTHPDGSACPAERLCEVRDWLSPARVVRFSYDASARLSKVTDREGQATTYGYDGTSHRLTTITDANGHVAVTNTYGADGRVATQQDARGLLTGQQTTFSYGTNPTDGTLTTTVTYPATSFDGSPFQHLDTYDGVGRLVTRVSKPTATEQSTESFTYGPTGFRASATDARGHTTTFCYDIGYNGAAIGGSRGNLTRRIDPPPAAGGTPAVTLFAYDGKHNLTQTVPPKGVGNGATVTCATDLSASVNTLYATDLAYDSATQTKLETVTRRSTDPDQGQQTAVTKFEYGDSANPGLVTRVIPPRGNAGGSPDYSYATSFAYFTAAQAPAKAGLLQEVVDPLGHKTTYDYDAVGRRTSRVDPLGYAAGGVPAEHTWEYQYDAEDRLRFAKAPAPSAGGSQLVTEFRYDAVGNREVVLDAQGQVTKYVYDERDSLKEVRQSPNIWTDPNATPSGLIVSAYQYDHLGNLSRVVRAQGDGTYERAVDYAYDGLNRLRTETQYPSWPSTSPTLLTQSAYDGNGNRTSLLDPLGQTTTFSYDALNRLTGIAYSDPGTPDVTYGYDAHGNRTSMQDGTGTTSYVYDELDRLLSVTSPATPSDKTVGYRYDLDGNRTRVIYPDSTAVSSTFDKASRLASLLDWGNRTTAYQYFADGSLQQATLPNGTTAAYTYDNALRLKQVWHQQGSNTISRQTYTLDALGNRTQLDEVLPQLGAPGPIAGVPAGGDFLAEQPACWPP
jgi:YD repeat-containing protein